MAELLRILKSETGLSDQDLDKIIRTAPERYKTYPIPKRNGSGNRMISQPAREVKFMQRILMEQVLSRFPVHDSASAYKPGASILKNARVHAQSGPILKIDFENFFPSIRETDWANLAASSGLDEEDIWISSRLFFKRDPRRRGLRLSIGAPSSPLMSNILMYSIDQRIDEEVAGDPVRYTRYADDLTFSAPRTGFLNTVEKQLRKILRESPYPILKINTAKTVYATKKFRRQVTGLILTNDGSVSVGRDRKRNLFAAVHNHLKGGAEAERVRETLGLIAFVSSVEDDFMARLKRKYGDDVLDRLRDMTE